MPKKHAKIHHTVRLLGRDTKGKLPVFEEYSPVNVTLRTSVNSCIKWVLTLLHIALVSRQILIKHREMVRVTVSC